MDEQWMLECSLRTNAGHMGRELSAVANALRRAALREEEMEDYDASSWEHVVMPKYQTFIALGRYAGNLSEYVNPMLERLAATGASPVDGGTGEKRYCNFCNFCSPNKVFLSYMLFHHAMVHYDLPMSFEIAQGRTADTPKTLPR
jgi:hypothetical protein